jgi:alkanesulfonate monooxygenase SsuD/methylene tetrahydromethanopterin reductase-like flavin-dependent oxidoreductase (luciferase family)
MARARINGRTGSACGLGAAAKHLTGQRAAADVVLEGDLTIHDGMAIAVGATHTPPVAVGQVGHFFRRPQAQLLQVVDHDVLQFKLPSELRHSPMGKAMMIGTVDQVARKLEQFRKDFVCTHLIMSTQLPGLDPTKATASLELFAKEIMPSLRNS